MLMGHQERGYVERSSSQNRQPLLNGFQTQAAVNHKQRFIKLYEQRVTTATTA